MTGSSLIFLDQVSLQSWEEEVKSEEYIILIRISCISIF